MSEWLKEHAWKACAGVILLPWVRIPLSPPSAFLAPSPFAPAGPCCTVASMGTVLPRRVLRSGPFARPDEARIRAAAAMLVGRLRPDQLILHGSAARGEMTEHSDLDFLSVRTGYPEPNRAPTQHRWHCAETGDVVDVLLVSREQLEKNRLAGGTVHAAALTEGRTVFASPGVEPVTHPVRTTLFAPDNAGYHLKLAGAFLRSADVAAEGAPEAGCRNLQESAERSLKALVIASGRPVAAPRRIPGQRPVDEAGTRRDLRRRRRRRPGHVHLHHRRQGLHAPD